MNEFCSRLKLAREWLVVAGLLVMSLTANRSAELPFVFADAPLNETPAGFQSVVGGEGKPGEWKVVLDEVPSSLPSFTEKPLMTKRSVLGQLSRDITDEHFPMLIYTNLDFGDFKFTTKFRCVGGAIEQMAGVVFRYQDPKNYYYLRASAKGKNFRFSKVVQGQRPDPIGPEIEISKGEWHELSVECKGNQILCSLDGKLVIPSLTDNSFQRGKVGFWTKSDAVSHFTDARVEYSPREPLARKLVREMQERYPRVLALRMSAKVPGKENVQIVASTRDEELGQPGAEFEEKAMEKNSPYFGHLKGGKVVVTMPLHDRNGETVAALRIEMKSFLGQTENNALGRALPIAHDIERRIVESKDLF